MATSKTFVILLVCLFQVYGKANAVDIKEDCENLLANFFKEVHPVRQAWLSTVHNADGITFEDVVKNAKPIVTEFVNNADSLLENIEENDYADDSIDGAMVRRLTEVSQLFDGYERASDNEEYKGFVLSILDDIKDHGVSMTEDYGNDVLKYVNERAHFLGEFLNQMEGMDDDAKVDNFEAYFAAAQEKINEAQNILIGPA